MHTDGIRGEKQQHNAVVCYGFLNISNETESHRDVTWSGIIPFRVLSYFSNKSALLTFKIRLCTKMDITRLVNYCSL